MNFLSDLGSKLTLARKKYLVKMKSS